MPLRPSIRTQPANAKRYALLLLSLSLALLTASAAQFGKRTPPKRPHLLGIAGVTLLVPNIQAAHRFYRDLIDPDHTCEYCDNSLPQFLFLPNGQRIEFKTIPSPAPTSLLEQVVFLTNDLDGYRRFLSFRKVQYDEIKRKHTGDVAAILLDDPEGHHLSITDSYHLEKGDDVNAGLPPRNTTNPVRIIHAGFVVNSLDAVNLFYRDLLGFKPYWHGGMKDDKDDWVAMQVPDGTDWVEYMLNIPATADKQTLGVMNHIALGVPNVHVTAYDLAKLNVKAPEPAQIGRDGKWQLNLYDAGLTRIEFMEFKPVQKPCCSDFTGPHPEPDTAQPVPPYPQPKP